MEEAKGGEGGLFQSTGMMKEFYPNGSLRTRLLAVPPHSNPSETMKYQANTLFQRDNGDYPRPATKQKRTFLS